MWKTNSSDVYVVTRTLGRSMKVSLHASGQCHVRAPDPKGWTGKGEPPSFLDTWSIDTASQYQFPFSVVIPEQELRHGEWFQHRDPSLPLKVCVGAGSCRRGMLLRSCPPSPACGRRLPLYFAKQHAPPARSCRPWRVFVAAEQPPLLTSEPGGQHHEVKEERRALPASGDTSGVAHPARSARAVGPLAP